MTHSLQLAGDAGCMIGWCKYRLGYSHLCWTLKDLQCILGLRDQCDCPPLTASLYCPPLGLCKGLWKSLHHSRGCEYKWSLQKTLFAKVNHRGLWVFLFLPFLFKSLEFYFWFCHNYTFLFYKLKLCCINKFPLYMPCDYYVLYTYDCLDRM